MRRRTFLALAGAMLTRAAFADAPNDVKITRITGLDITAKRSKVVGKNARLDVHGDTIRERIVRIMTSSGAEGIGVCRADEKALAQLLGKSPRECKALLGVHTMPLWDLLGKLAGRPVYELFRELHKTPGKPALADVPVYDGSVYFSDLLDEHAANWADRFKWEIDEILSRGQRAFKVKIGRGHRWMQRDAGDARDREVLSVIRAHAGRDITIGVDANNGYDLPRTKRLIEALPDFDFAFIEEMFPESIEPYLELKEFLRQRGVTTLIADGETQHSVEPLVPLMKARAVDVYQLDVNAVGCEGLLEEAALCRPHGGTIAPHTWGTLLGFYAQLHVARAIDNFYSGEQDPLNCDVVIADGYTIKNGRCTVSDAPGFGLKLDEQKLSSIEPAFDLKS